MHASSPGQRQCIGQGRVEAMHDEIHGELHDLAGARGPEIGDLPGECREDRAQRVDERVTRFPEGGVECLRPCAPLVPMSQTTAPTGTAERTASSSSTARVASPVGQWADDGLGTSHDAGAIAGGPHSRPAAIRGRAKALPMRPAPRTAMSARTRVYQDLACRCPGDQRLKPARHDVVKRDDSIEER